MPFLVPQYRPEVTFRSDADFRNEVSVSGLWAAHGSFTVNGLVVTQSALNSLYYVIKYLGEQNVPADVRRLRKYSLETMRRMGQPVIVKHMFNDRDFKDGLVQKSPSAYDAYGQQVRNRDPFSHGTGYCSKELSPNEWLDPRNGSIFEASTSPGPGFVQAPRYRGYGPGYLTYIIEPDVPLDLYKLSPTGALIKTQSQTVQAPWWPEINDNDLIINVELDGDGNVVNTHERYEAKMTTPITIRGLDNRGHREFSADHGNRHVINQNFEASLAPQTSTLYDVEADR